MNVRAALVAACVLATAAASTTPASAVTPVVVVASPSSEQRPAASTTFVAWGKEQHHNTSVRAEAIGGSSFRVSAKAFPGAIDGSTLVYSKDGDIALFDLSTRAALPVPDGVNTKAYEQALGISGTHLLFYRASNFRSYSVVLFDTSTGTSL